ncbi:MAG: class I SAM-dependent methyltransferase [Thermomicrobiales bacterium]
MATATTPPHWFPDELAHAGDEHLDDAYVQGYDRKASTDPTAEIALFRRLGLNETGTLVDLGAGTGTLALAAAPLCRRVVAVDVSRAMLNRLNEKAARLGINNIECVQSGFLTYEHRGDPADVVYSRNALHHLPDFWKAIALDRIAATLKPGGVLRLRDIVFSCDGRDATSIIEAWFARASTQPGVGWTRAELGKDVREEHITFNWLLEPLLERAGFTIQDANHEASRVFSAYTCIKSG